MRFDVICCCLLSIALFLVFERCEGSFKGGLCWVALECGGYYSALLSGLLAFDIGLCVLGAKCSLLSVGAIRGGF